MKVRHSAFLQALEQHQLESNPEHTGSSYYITQCMETHLPRLLQLGITAIICSHDQIANAAIIQCQQLGYHVPKDISIIGFDDLAISAYTSPPLTTIRCSHDQIANAAIIQCQQLGYHVPKDISIIGFDDLAISAYTSPPLTTIRQDRVQLGKSAYAALTSLMEQVEIGTLLLHAKLIVRDSTGKYFGKDTAEQPL